MQLFVAHDAGESLAFLPVAQYLASHPYLPGAHADAGGGGDVRRNGSASNTAGACSIGTIHVLTLGQPATGMFADVSAQYPLIIPVTLADLGVNITVINQKSRTQLLSDADLATVVRRFTAGPGAVGLVVVGMVYDMQRQIARAFGLHSKAQAPHPAASPRPWATRLASVHPAAARNVSDTARAPGAEAAAGSGGGGGGGAGGAGVRIDVAGFNDGFNEFDASSLPGSFVSEALVREWWATAAVITRGAAAFIKAHPSAAGSIVAVTTGSPTIASWDADRNNATFAAATRARLFGYAL